MHLILRLLLTLIPGALLVDSAMAALTGQIEARLVITSGCEVSQGNSPAGVNGGVITLDFGSPGPPGSRHRVVV